MKHCLKITAEIKTHYKLYSIGISFLKYKTTHFDTGGFNADIPLYTTNTSEEGVMNS